MKLKRTRLTDFHYDILKYIMIFVAKSSDGAANFARAISVSKVFGELSTDKDILRAMNFDNAMLSEIHGSFWLDKGLLSQCARARNLAACKIILQRLENLLKSANVKIDALLLVAEEMEEWIVVIERQACTRSMTRRITSIINLSKMIMDDVQKDTQHVKELRLALKK